MEKRQAHSERLARIKAECSDAERDLESKSGVQVHQAADLAYQEAVEFLIHHTNSIKKDNRVLRQELYQLLQDTQVVCKT